MSDNELRELLITNGFELQNQSDMTKIVSQQILYLLEHDLNRLYSILYRIDVSESKAKAAFGGTTEDIAQKLTQLIIERLQQKIISRKKG
jgi:hypothetical protein